VQGSAIPQASRDRRYLSRRKGNWFFQLGLPAARLSLHDFTSIRSWPTKSWN